MSNLHYCIYIPQEELDFMAKVILDAPNIETGGNLFGYWTNQGDAVILYVLGPGKKANYSTQKWI